MENGVPGALTRRSVDRSLHRRRAAYENEVERLVAASLQLIREQGRLEPRVSEIVAAAGLSNQAFYRHFQSKDELLLAVLDEGVRLLAGYLRHRMERAPTPEAGIREWIAGLLEQALNSEAAAATRPFAVSRARLAELFPEEVEASERQLTQLLRDAIAAASGAPPDSPADAAAERDADAIYTLAMGWVQRRLAQPALVSRGDAEHIVDFALRGLRKQS